jgi:hypothetical protein
MSKTLTPTPERLTAKRGQNARTGELDGEKSQLIEENTRLHRALHLLLATWPVETDASLWEQ